MIQPATLHPRHARGRPPRAVVIGSGLGGLAAAIRLLAAGLEVTVVESGPAPGGRAGQIKEGGFTFDTGPSLITMPDVLEDLFATAGIPMSDRLRLVPLDPFYRIAWEGDERSFLFSGDRASMLAEIGRFSHADSLRYDAFLAASRRIHEEAVMVAGKQSFLQISDFLRLVPRMARLGALRTVDGFVGRFFREPHVRQAFDFHPLFIGGAPFRVPAVYAALAYLQIAGAVWYARGGVYALVEALADLVRSGGTLHLNSPVRRILHDRGRVCGIELADGEILGADYVVSNADVVTTQRDLLGRAMKPPRLTMSCYLLYLGTDRPFPQLSHHTLLVGQDYHGFIRDVTVTGRVPTSLSLYLHAPSRTEPEMAIPGGESISVLLPIPNLANGADWSLLEPELRDRVVSILEADEGLGLRGLSDSIVVERSWTPLDFRDRLGAADGNAFGPEPTLRQSAYFRQPNRDRQIGGLYYVGAGTHPGAGIPGVLMTADVTTSLIEAEVGARA